MSHDITLHGSIIGSGDTLSDAVTQALDLSTESFPRRLVRVHDVDGETMVVEVRDGKIETLMPGVRVSQVGFPAHGSRAQVGTVIVPDETRQSLIANLSDKARAAIACVCWDENAVETEVVVWSQLTTLAVIGLDRDAMIGA